MQPKEMIELARKAIVNKKIEKTGGEKTAVFVTLEKNGELRGCIGFTEPVFPIEEAIQKAAFSAAYEDPRFTPLNEKEIEEITVEISVLSKPKKISIEDVKQGDGLILECGNNRGVLLPQVWDKIKDKKEFLDVLCMKSGLEKNCWDENEISLFRFSVDIFSEETPMGKIIKK